MTERKFVRLWITVFVAIVALFAFTEVRAASTGTPAGENVTLDGYNVTVVRDGGFPSLAGGDSVFNWKISGTAAAIANVNTIDIKIPVEVDSSYAHLNSNIVVSIIPATGPGCTLVPFTLKNLTGWALAPKGAGDLTTSIGRFEYDYYVLAIVPPKTGPCAITKTTTNTKVQVKFKGKSLKSDLNSFLVRASFFGEALNLFGPSMTGGSTSSAQGPIRSFESFRLGDTGCRMDIDLEDGTRIKKGVSRSISNPEYTGDDCYAVLDITPMRNRFFCEHGDLTKCLPKTFVERAIMEKSGLDSKYCYSSAGYSVCR
jgi:hypothetical protein